MSEARREWKLPKNIRQVGDGGGEKKIYIEDYVVTYLNHVAEKKEPAKALLLGTVKERNLYPYIFIDAAVEVDDFRMDDEKRKETEKQIEKNFGIKNVVGWFFSSRETPFVMNHEVIEVYQECFSGENQVLMVLEAEGEELIAFFLEDEVVVEQPGYSIYYEKNQPMQNLLISQSEGKSMEEEEAGKDDVIHRFRKIIRRYQSNQETPEKGGRLSYVAGGFLVMTMLALGVTMIYNYDRMKEVEKSLALLTGNVESQAEYITETVETAEPVMLHIDEEIDGLMDETQEEQSDSTRTDNLADRQTDSREAAAVQTHSETETETESENSAFLENGRQESSPADTDESAEQDTRDSSSENTADSSRQTSGTVRSSYIVKVGDTLAGISQMYYGGTDRVEEICSLNGITDENTILPGQKILLP